MTSICPIADIPGMIGFEFCLTLISQQRLFVFVAGKSYKPHQCYAIVLLFVQYRSSKNQKNSLKP